MVRRRSIDLGKSTDLRVINGADDGVRTRDPDLGKVVLYQLSHVRVVGGTRFELVTPTVSR